MARWVGSSTTLDSLHKFFSLAAAFLLIQHGVVALEEGEPAEYLLPIGGPKEVVPERVKQKNLEVVLDFLDSLSGELPVNITLASMSGEVPQMPATVPGLAENVSGQITPLGLFENLVKSIEYFYAMPRAVSFRAAITTKMSFFNLVTSDNPAEEVIETGLKRATVSAFADGNMVSTLTYFYIGLGKNNTFFQAEEGEPTFIFSGKWFLDRDSNICGYDVVVPNFATSFPIDPLRQGGFPSPEALAMIPDSPWKRAYLPSEGVTTWLEEICDVATGDMCFPVTNTTYYADKEDCMEKLGQKRAGTYADLDQDTLACRALHRLLVPSRPEGHCMHLASDLSEEDGGTCIDRTSSDYLKRNFQCGYDDVGYTPAVGPRTAQNGVVSPRAWVNGGYPHSLSDFARTEPYTVPMPECSLDGSGKDGYIDGGYGL